ncbi:MAG: ABC transporter permease subunit [Thiohalomonadaceae bacterium]
MTESVAKAASGDSARVSLLPSGEQRARLRRWRYAKDRISRYGVAIGGLGVVVALALIFVYLFYEVFPMLRPASVEPVSTYTLPVEVRGDQVADLTTERYTEVAGIYGRDGSVTFLNPRNGELRKRVALPLPQGVSVVSSAAAEVKYGLLARGLSDGRVLVTQHEYTVTYPDDVRHTEPEITYPLGEAPLLLDEQGAPLVAVGIQAVGEGFALAGATADGRLTLAIYRAAVSFMTGEVEIKRDAYGLPPLAGRPTHILINKNMRNLFVADAEGYISHYDIVDPDEPRLLERVRVVGEGVTITDMRYLSGTVSIIVGGSDGSLAQWFPVRDEQNEYHLTRIRGFEQQPGAITFIAPEYTRKGFVAGDASGHVGAHFTTSGRSVLLEKVSDAAITGVTMSPVNDTLLVIDAGGQMHFLKLHNEHPEISLKALWGKVWYENRAGEEYVWQASSGSDDFEPKLSLTPLTLGTIKAAFFAMVFAIPLAIMGALYTAYFMTPRLRGFVKPSIEIMEALPTVILGFLAGLWLAPFMENNLPAVFSILLLMPLAMLAVAYAWANLPGRLRLMVPPGWEAAILMPVILLVGWLCIVMSPTLEVWFFNGSMRQWLTEVGITYDQRNALVVGIAMGFAVIPTIFSIAEDAIFTVPRHLTQGSLALGATPWQTMVGVVLPTASPGIFAAVMMGFGRAVGETMIVLMATGNSPVMNFNIFEGMRTLSANIAVELPETPLGSTHFRVLFLAALVLLVLTFVMNTAAEIVRQRLRKRYSTL